MQSETHSSQHTLIQFENDLDLLQRQLLQMLKLIILHLDRTIQALNTGDTVLAQQVVAGDFDVNQLEIKIDADTLNIIALHTPVANDLRTVLTSAKIADELEKLGNEIAAFAKVVLILFDPKTSNPNPKLLIDIVKIAYLIKQVLDNLLNLLGSSNSELAHAIMQCNRQCQMDVQEGIKHQLSFVIEDARLIGRTLDIMDIFKSLELCTEYCRNIIKYTFYMQEGFELISLEQP